ncbi:MAG: flavin reductase family protein [Alloprevotella sp.]|nr:flavin reductase [Bacteroidales bacterium]MDY3943664.1 flavin reductase family protein [Alloprevotella sp.]
MQKIDVNTLQENPFHLLGKEWSLVAAGNTEHFDMLTTSWGGLCVLWNKPVAVVFIRENRYTREFIEANKYVTVSFYGTDRQSRHILNICGTRSGRDCDKAKELGLSPVATDNGAVTFKQARLTLEGRKVYCMPIEEANFLDRAIYEKWYNDSPGGEKHYAYFLEITNAYVNDDPESRKLLANDDAGVLW